MLHSSYSGDDRLRDGNRNRDDEMANGICNCSDSEKFAREFGTDKGEQVFVRVVLPGLFSADLQLMIAGFAWTTYGQSWIVKGAVFSFPVTWGSKLLLPTQLDFFAPLKGSFYQWKRYVVTTRYNGDIVLTLWHHSSLQNFDRKFILICHVTVIK